jgi:hypothetical protein
MISSLQHSPNILDVCDIITCIRGVIIRRGLDCMIGFIALIQSIRNYK